MAETKFTAGPWIANGMIVFGGAGDVVAQAPSQKPADANSVPAMIPNPEAEDMLPGVLDADDPCLANAHLIAAAPELYGALSECVQLHYPFTGKYDEKKSLDHWLSEDKEGNGEAKFWIAAHAALRKARGEAQ